MPPLDAQARKDAVHAVEGYAEWSTWDSGIRNAVVDAQPSVDVCERVDIETERHAVQVGVDGVGVAGYVPRSPPMTIRLLASSNSLVIFENWVAAMDTLQDILLANAQITLPALGRKYTCYQGALLDVSTLADARKVLANREFRIQWLPGQTPGVPAITVAPI